MRITYATMSTPGRVNEDYALCGNEWAVVFDGATAFPGVESGCVHDVPWLVRHLAAAVARHLLLDFASLPDLLAEAIEEAKAAHGPACDLGNPDSPSSTISIVRVRDDVAEYLTLGDSPIVIRSADQALTAVIDDRLAHLPGGRPYTRELVRSLRNQPGGFWVASTSPEAAYRAVTGSAPFEPGSEIGIFTDGASRLVEFYGYEWEHVFSIMETGGPGSVIDLVRTAERERPLRSGKQHDDATAVLMADCGPVRPARSRMEHPANWRDLVGM
jgi:protein phosphatase 2C-like protein